MKKKKVIIIASSVIAFIIAAAIIAVLFVMSHFLDEGRRSLTLAQETFNEHVYKNCLEKAVLEIEKAVLYGNYSVIGREKLVEAYYALGLANLYQRNNVKAAAYFKKAKEFLGKNQAFKSDLESKIIQSSVRVEGIAGKGVALVNQDFVNVGDSINGVSVVEVTDTYVVFRSGNFIFSDSINKYSPLAKKDRLECKSIFEKASKSVNPGFALDYYSLAEAFSKAALKNFAMDASQTSKLKAIIEKSKDTITLIENNFKGSIEKKELTVGLSKKDVKEIWGEPLNILKDESVGEIWNYPGKKLFFDNDLSFGIEGILTYWE